MSFPSGHRRPDPVRFGGAPLPRDVAEAAREQQQNDPRW